MTSSKVAIGVVSALAFYLIYSAVSTNLMLGFIFIFGIAIMAAVKTVIHNADDTETRIKLDKYTALEVAGLTVTIGIVLASAGRFLI